MTTTILRTFTLGLAALALAALPAAAHETHHELRINSITALTVAQQITQPAVCPQTGTCLHNEIRLPVHIDFDAGTIMIDATAPTDENGTPVLPGNPGGMLFRTQSGPAELTFAPPCENPDGCVGGIAMYFGTIDQGGRITFPSIGLDFQLFGVSPISKFRGPMGTGDSIDLADPSVVATGSALDFATGAVTLAGIDFIPAPIVGTTLQLDKIRGVIAPTPVPPVAMKDTLGCQTAIDKQGATYVKRAQKALGRCTDMLVACETNAEAAGGDPASCLTAAKLVCDAAVTSLGLAGDVMTRKIRAGCQNIGAANMLAAEGGLGFSLDKPLCDALGVNASTRDGIATCMLRRMQCSLEEMIAQSEPRAATVLAANGYPQFTAPAGCMPAFTPGDATGRNGAQLVRCQNTLSAQAAKYGGLKQKKLEDCLLRVLDCHLHAEEMEHEGGMHEHDPVCVAKAQKTCDAAVRAIAAAGQKRLLATQGACAALDAADIPALRTGLGFENMVDRCLALTPPVTLANVDALLACVHANLDCGIEGAARVLKPRAAEADRIVALQVGGILLNDRFPCLEAKCGDGIVDVGEQCDPLVDPTDRCNADCTRVACGNGRLEPGEQCDDGNTTSGDGCSATCVIEPSSCGNGIYEPFGGEICDDNDTAGGDGCSADCKSKEVCGNGVVDTIVGEQCDDGGTQFVATLTGASETPAVATAATGSVTMTLNPDDTLTYSVTTSGLSGTMAHIHFGAVGVPGPIIINLSGGPATWSGTTAALGADQKSQLKAGLLYVNVHTAANPNGEIRGQLGFAAGVSGDGCSADCKSNETCGNGVIDAVTGETCDDGNTVAGDGCDASCHVEACGFAGSPTPLGTRMLSVDPATSKIFNSIVGLGSPVGNISVPTGPLSLTAGAPDATGSATVTLDGDVIVQIDIALGGTVQCFKFEAATTVGHLNCCGGHAVGMSNTRDSNTGGLPATGGQSNGPQIQLGGIGTGGPGDLLMAFTVRETGGATGFNCATASYTATPRTVFWTTGQAAARVLRPAQGGALFEFKTTGQPFDCANWTVENGPGTLISADTALNAVPGVDAGNIRKLDD